MTETKVKIYQTLIKPQERGWNLYLPNITAPFFIPRGMKAVIEVENRPEYEPTYCNIYYIRQDKETTEYTARSDEWFP